MTDIKGTYQIDGQPKQIDHHCLLRYDEPNYKPPDHEQVTRLKNLSGKTGGELAKLAGVDARTFRKWIAPAEVKNSSRIPYAAWRLLLVELKLLNN